METKLSTPLEEPPSFLSMVSMVGDDQADTVRQLVHAERKSPPFNEPARQLFLSVLEGKFTYQGALAQAKQLSDQIERKCARVILEASKKFLAEQPAAHVGRLQPMGILLPKGLELGVSPVWLRHLLPKRLLILHFWQEPLSNWQRSAAAGILMAAMERHNPVLTRLEIDFISISEPAFSAGRHLNAGRRLKEYGWHNLDRLDGDDLRRFLDRFCDAWDKYKRLPPREIRQRNKQAALF
jgi:hypothetical protein